MKTKNKNCFIVLKEGHNPDPYGQGFRIIFIFFFCFYIFILFTKGSQKITRKRGKNRKNRRGLGNPEIHCAKRRKKGELWWHFWKKLAWAALPFS